MESHREYMKRCLELAAQGLGQVAPNPLVGSVIVCDGQIIGEGFHRRFGGAHAEAEAIRSVTRVECLPRSTLYVNLEPCAHFGKTPPCSDLILEHHIPRVVIGSIDNNPLVAGKGADKLRKGGCDVITGCLEETCRELNRRFYTFYEKKRPYIVLKWAQTRDGFIDRERKTGQAARPAWISGEPERRLVHKWRTEEQAIMVGTRTALMDDPRLNVRHWTGKQPIRLVIDRNAKLPGSLKLFDNSQESWIFTTEKEGKKGRNEWVCLDREEDLLPAILEFLHNREVQSVLVEGGSRLLQSFLDSRWWDEARVFTGQQEFRRGVRAPVTGLEPVSIHDFDKSRLELFRNPFPATV